MKESKSNRSLWLNLRLTQEEKQFLLSQCQATTCRTVSEYTRHVLLKKPITAKIRNQSQDELLAEITALRNELKAIGTNLNQATKKLHSLRSLGDFKEWVLLFDQDKQELIKGMESIDTEVKKMVREWLPS